MKRPTHHINAAVHARAVSSQQPACKLTEIHDVIPTNSAVVYNDVPGPECNSIPLEKKNSKLATNTLTRDWSYMTKLHSFIF